MPPLPAARAKRRRDHGLEQAALAVGRGAEGAQVPRSDPEARERVARRRDVRLALGIESLAVLQTRLEQPELFQLASTVGRDACAVAELREIELLLPISDDAAPPAPLRAPV